MDVRKLVVALPAATLLAFGSAAAAGAQGLSPALAAELNAGTAATGLGLNGSVGAGISAVVPDALNLVDVEVAGVQLGYLSEGGSPTVSTTGVPHRAALLNAGTAWSAIGPFGRIGIGIAGPLAPPPTHAQLASDEYFVE